MAEQTPVSLNHYTALAFKDAYWSLSGDERAARGAELAAALRAAGTAVHFYQLFPTEAAADLLVWCAVKAPDSGEAARFFDRFARAVNPFRRFLHVADVLWGLTKPSQYTKVRSTQEIDPFDQSRHPYLIVYPFVKTTDWYLLSRDLRQGMMNEHIRIGKSYSEITQLLLYSYGLQDQEFVVVYETDELSRFSGLVHDLRLTEGRRYTERDSPLHSAVYRPGDEAFDLCR